MRPLSSAGSSRGDCPPCSSPALALVALGTVAADSLLIVAITGEHTKDIAGRPDLAESFVTDSQYRAQFVDPIVADLRLTVLARNCYRGSQWSS